MSSFSDPKVSIENTFDHDDIAENFLIEFDYKIIKIERPWLCAEFFNCPHIKQLNLFCD